LSRYAPELEDFIRALELAVLAFELLRPRDVVRRRARPLARVALIVADPVT
jgi:hypothetical protein